MSLQKWLAREKPKKATSLRFFVNGDAYGSWPSDSGELSDFAEFAKSLHSIGEHYSEESGQQVALRVAWFDRMERELPSGYSWTVGYSSGQAPMDGSPNASAVNAQRHLEAMARIDVQKQQASMRLTSQLIEGYKELAMLSKQHATESINEARMLRAELRAWREKGADIVMPEDDGPSALTEALERLPAETREQLGPLAIAALWKFVGGSAASSDASSTTTNETNDTNQEVSQ